MHLGVKTFQCNVYERGTAATGPFSMTIRSASARVRDMPRNNSPPLRVPYPLCFLQRVGYRAKLDRSPRLHPKSVILSGAARALCEQRSRRTCHTARTRKPLEAFNHERSFKPQPNAHPSTTHAVSPQPPTPTRQNPDASSDATGRPDRPDRPLSIPHPGPARPNPSAGSTPFLRNATHP